MKKKIKDLIKRVEKKYETKLLHLSEKYKKVYEEFDTIVDDAVSEVEEGLEKLGFHFIEFKEAKKGSSKAVYENDKKEKILLCFIDYLENPPYKQPVVFSVELCEEK